MLSSAACSGETKAPEPDIDAGLLCTTCGSAPTCDEHFEILSAQHVAGPIAYPTQPPVGGLHSQCWANWGEQQEPLKPERWVHNLEHGGIVLLYHCPDGCASELDQLRGFMAEHPRTLLTAYEALPKRFAAVAWEYRLLSDCLDLTAFANFYEQRFDHAPESIDSGPPAICDERPEL